MLKNYHVRPTKGLGKGYGGNYADAVGSRLMNFLLVRRHRDSAARLENSRPGSPPAHEQGRISSSMNFAFRKRYQITSGLHKDAT